MNYSIIYNCYDWTEVYTSKKKLHVIQIHKDFSFNRDFCSSQDSL